MNFLPVPPCFWKKKSHNSCAPWGAFKQLTPAKITSYHFIIMIRHHFRHFMGANTSNRIFKTIPPIPRRGHSNIWTFTKCIQIDCCWNSIICKWFWLLVRSRWRKNLLERNLSIDFRIGWQRDGERERWIERDKFNAFSASNSEWPSTLRSAELDSHSN